MTPSWLKDRLDHVFVPMFTTPVVKVRLDPIVRFVPNATDPELIRFTVIDESVCEPLTNLRVPSAPVPPTVRLDPVRSPLKPLAFRLTSLRGWRSTMTLKSRSRACSRSSRRALGRNASTRGPDRCHDGGWMKPLSPTDAMFLWLEGRRQPGEPSLSQQRSPIPVRIRRAPRVDRERQRA